MTRRRRARGNASLRSGAGVSRARLRNRNSVVPDSPHLAGLVEIGHPFATYESYDRSTFLSLPAEEGCALCRTGWGRREGSTKYRVRSTECRAFRRESSAPRCLLRIRYFVLRTSYPV